MSDQVPRRRLAAILAADVVGYSRMMQADEAGTLAALKVRRTDILQPLVTRHHGRIVKLVGDGVLIEFASAVNAVECAVRLQKDMSVANAALPEDRRIVLRIGVNLGDVMVEGGDLYGDGVNIASRLEALAEPGSVVVSGKVRQEIVGKLECSFEDLGDQKLKNMAEPVRVFRMSAVPAPARSPMPTKEPASKPSIAVLPFANMSGDPEQKYFSDGLTEDIITELSRFHSLIVIARNSSFQYRDKAVDIKRVARELDINYIVEGSVRRAAERVRISAQLIDASTEGHVWAQHYDRSLSDVFAIQDELTTAIAAKVAGHVQVAAINKVRRMRTDSMAAYDLFLRSLEHINRAGSEDTILARQYAERAIEIDPDFALAHALLAASLAVTCWDESYKDKKTATLGDALRVARRAVALDVNDAQCHCILAYVQIAKKSFDLAAHHLEIAIQLNPNDADALSHRATLELFTGKPKLSLKTLQEAIRLNPVHPNWYRDIEAVALYQLGRYAEAAGALEKASALRPYATRYLAACYAQLDRVEDARALTAEVLRLDPGFTLSAYAKVEPYESAKDLEHMREGMRKAGLPE
jgi:TolB-like protein/Flp pilus assembly protein TadD